MNHHFPKGIYKHCQNLIQNLNTIISSAVKSGGILIMQKQRYVDKINLLI